MNCEEILIQLEFLSNPEAVAGMARFGINPGNIYGVSIPNLRKIAKEAGNNLFGKTEFAYLKAVEWSKRDEEFVKRAIETAKEIQRMDSKSSKWIASDAIRELTSEVTQKRLLCQQN